MKIYLAARYPRRRELREYDIALTDAGHLVTSRWVWQDEDHTPENGWKQSADWKQAAERDIHDMFCVDVLILFTEDPDTPWVRGSRHFEAGYMHGKGQRSHHRWPA